jgi:hypothetical protein
MDWPLKYATTLWVLGAITYAVVTIGFSRSIDFFKPDRTVVTASESIPETSTPPSYGAAVSDLAGSRTTTVEQPASSKASSSTAGASEKAPADHSFVEVKTDVNVRGGPSTSRPVIGVQRRGTTLQVTSREKGWLEVIDPESNVRGWVFSRFVKDAASPGQQTAVFDEGER